MRRMIALALSICLAAPAFAPAYAQAPDRNFVIFFQEWSAAFDTAAQSVIASAALAAAAHPSEKVLVLGYADPTGSARANALISALRAELVSNALIDGGIDAARIERHGFGETGYQLSSQESRRVTVSIGPK